MTMSWRLTDTKGTLCHTEAEYLMLQFKLSIDTQLLNRISKATRTGIANAKIALSDALTDLYKQIRWVDVVLREPLKDSLVATAGRYANRENRRVVHIDPQLMGAVIPEQRATTIDPHMYDEYRQALRSFLLHYPEKGRLLLEYAKVEHGDHEMLAATLGVTYANLRKMYSRNRKDLRTHSNMLKCQDHIIRRTRSRVRLTDGTIIDMQGRCIVRRGRQFIFVGVRRSDSRPVEVKCSTIERIAEIDELGDILA